MEEEHRHSSPTSLSFVQALTLLFIGLKLTDHIDWSWWWVLSPVLMSVVLGIIIGAKREFIKAWREEMSK